MPSQHKKASSVSDHFEQLDARPTSSSLCHSQVFWVGKCSADIHFPEPAVGRQLRAS